MPRTYKLVALASLVAGPTAGYACEPVLPLMQTMQPALALSRSFALLALAVVVKSVLFAIFERRISPVRAAWRMLLGNVLTSIVGVFVAAMIASGMMLWVFGVPLAFGLCWIPARRLVKAAPLQWLANWNAAGVAAVLTVLLQVSCVLFFAGGVGRLKPGEVHSNLLVGYWITKLVAIFLALLASITLTTIWEEWAIWRLSSRPEGTGYFTAALRANLYVLVLLMAIPAAMILPTRLKSPNFLAKRTNVPAAQTGSWDVQR